MDLTLLSLVTCIIAQVLGLVTVLISMHLLSVPQFESFSQTWRRTRCYIRNITFSIQEITQAVATPSPGFNGSVVSLGNTRVSILDTENTEGSPPKYKSGEQYPAASTQTVLCAHVYVDYVAKDNSIRQTYLLSKPSATNASTYCDSIKNCFCCNCTGSADVTASPETNSLDNPVSYLQQFALKVGDPLDCFQGSRSRLTLASRHSGSIWKSLQVIIWPTLLFVVGFVGSFFSFINWFEQQQCRKDRHFNDDVPMETIL